MGPSAQASILAEPDGSSCGRGIRSIHVSRRKLFSRGLPLGTSLASGPRHPACSLEELEINHELLGCCNDDDMQWASDNAQFTGNNASDIELASRRLCGSRKAGDKAIKGIAPIETS
ncbi:hypothetical protein RHGRI_026426 [Rhododendron griersonianum]|uniref:Uncharacterized protein n=1 Tax=Rhododendron griersonianum TaxID=479676 RepID=A0AAV6ITR6_9ERIC|nr:hypothetical protein RHGRI_026426 [Rhododendron griersonianum]